MRQPSLTPSNTKNSKIRSVIIALVILITALSIYAYQYVIIFNSKTSGIVYGEATSKGGNYTLHSLKYYYTHNGITFFDQVNYMGENELQVGDSLLIRVLKPHPRKHAIETIYRNNNHPKQYDGELFFDTQYHMHINKLSDYVHHTTDTLFTPEGKQLIYPQNMSQQVLNATIKSIDAIRFNRGSLIEHYLLNTGQDTLYLYPVYFYLDEYSVEGHPALALHNELKANATNLKVYLSILDKNNPKHERKLTVNP